jgi:hypothetical protein
MVQWGSTNYKNEKRRYILGIRFNFCSNKYTYLFPVAYAKGEVKISGIDHNNCFQTVLKGKLVRQGFTFADFYFSFSHARFNSLAQILFGTLPNVWIFNDVLKTESAFVFRLKTIEKYATLMNPLRKSGLCHRSNFGSIPHVSTWRQNRSQFSNLFFFKFERWAVSKI